MSESTVFCDTPVIRHVELIEFPSTRAVITLVRFSLFNLFMSNNICLNVRQVKRFAALCSRWIGEKELTSCHVATTSVGVSMYGRANLRVVTVFARLKWDGLRFRANTPKVVTTGEYQTPALPSSAKFVLHFHPYGVTI